jgi:mono/diheme cytochrome c family protein
VIQDQVNVMLPQTVRGKEAFMSKVKSLSITLMGSFVLAAFSLGPAGCLLAQDRPGRKPTVKEQAMSQSETRGEGLFLQRCSLCHLPRFMKFGSPPVVGPSLSGVFKKASPDEEKTLRQFIQKGTADMPGFRYGLSATEMDELVSYLKTL